ncbi:MAG: glycoside hydrolase family 18 protein [Catonella sp.]|uniref:glycoside hydrolase family 18 protein n=1 Tax=Catonella sp. TaxID=2382125 RepID=UPI003F9F7AAE
MKRKKLIGYVSTKDLSFLSVSDIRALDVINLAFGHISNGCVIYAPDCLLEEYVRIRKENPECKIILSIGGWSAGGFSEAASSKDGREKFASSAVEIVKQYELDGIDIDWEYPCIATAGIAASPDDRENFTKLIKTARETLTSMCNSDKMLTIAAGAGEYYINSTKMGEVAKYLDYVQLMTYDLRGGYHICTGHHTNLLNDKKDISQTSAENAVKCFENAGVPREKLILGAAYYSRMWTGVPDRENGLHQMAESTGGYGPSYGQLVGEYINKNGYKRFFDEEARAPWLFNGDTFISYDDEESCREKAEYVVCNGLGGIMFWEYRLDETRSLTGVLRKALDTVDIGENL